VPSIAKTFVSQSSNRWFKRQGYIAGHSSTMRSKRSKTKSQGGVAKNSDLNNQQYDIDIKPVVYPDNIKGRQL